MIAVDVEGTGTEAHLHSILSVGAVDLTNPERQFYGECRAWDGAKIEDEALAVNGFSRQQATDSAKQTEAELTHKFIQWTLEVPDNTFVGQNPSYDRDFLKYAAERAGHTLWPFAHRTVDTHSLCLMHMIKRGLTPPLNSEKKHSALNLDAILIYCGIPEEPDPHNALTGAKSHAEVASRLLWDKKLLPDFAQYPIPWIS
jgi:DNA polymerase III epsilon subunit-like protein